MSTGKAAKNREGKSGFFLKFFFPLFFRFPQHLKKRQKERRFSRRHFSYIFDVMYLGFRFWNLQNKRFCGRNKRFFSGKIIGTYVCGVGFLFHGKQLQIVKIDCVEIPRFAIVSKYVTHRNRYSTCTHLRYHRSRHIVIYSTPPAPCPSAVGCV